MRSLMQLQFSAGFTKLTCLSLRGCSWLQPQGLAMLRSLPSLRALDLSDQYDAVTDEAGPLLASLPNLEALNLALTNVGDLLIDALTYSRRLSAWTQETGKVSFSHLRLSFAVAQMSCCFSALVRLSLTECLTCRYSAAS